MVYPMYCWLDSAGGDTYPLQITVKLWSCDTQLLQCKYDIKNAENVP